MSKKGAPFEFRDWAHLPPEIVGLISEKVKYIVDYVRFRTVCSHWRTASLPKPRHLPPQLPWLMLPYNSYEWGRDNGIRFFYDFWESKMRKLDLRMTRGSTCCASYRGWFLLVSYKGREVSLLNPLTGSKIELPCFHAWFDPYMIDFAKSKMIFSTDLTDPNCLIIVFLEKYWVLTCRVGDPCWARCCPRRNLADLTYHDGRLYVLYEEEMMIFESKKLGEEIVLCSKFSFGESILEPELAAVSKRFVEGKSGVYVVGVDPDEKFELYQFQEQQMKLKKITDTSDNTAIFYGGKDNYPCLALSSDDWDSLDGGSLYMENKCVPLAWKHAVQSDYESLSAQRSDGNVQLVHSLVKEPENQRVKPAMWFQPSFF